MPAVMVLVVMVMVVCAVMMVPMLGVGLAPFAFGLSRLQGRETKRRRQEE